MAMVRPDPTHVTACTYLPSKHGPRGVRGATSINKWGTEVAGNPRVHELGPLPLPRWKSGPVLLMPS